MSWGTHFCHFYDTKGDLLETVVPYFRAGLEDNEYCVWVTSEPLTEDECWAALRRAVPSFEQYVSRRSIEILPGREWYLDGRSFDRRRVGAAWNDRLHQALAQGYAGMRVSGNTSWLERHHWHEFVEYERELNESVPGQPMVVLCTYPLATSGAAELLDVARTHQFAIARREGRWEVVETPQLRQAREKTAQVQQDLERRVAERTRELEDANHELRGEIAERTRGQEQLVALRNQLATELLAMARLHDLATRLLADIELPTLLDEVLDAIIALQSADFGNVQLRNPETRALEIVAQRGFGPDFLEHFSRVDDKSAACGRALERHERVIIEDVLLDPGFAPHRAIAAAAGFRAVQSTPLVSREDGKALGMVSTHFRRPHRPSERELRLTDLYAAHAAIAIARKRAADEQARLHQALSVSGARFRSLAEAIPHHVWTYGPDEALNYCNQQWLDYSGLSFDEARAQGWARRLHPDDVERARLAWREAAAGRSLYEVEVRLARFDGSYRRFVSRGVPVYDDHGTLVQWFGTNTDVEERRQAEGALRQAQAELERVARVATIDELAASLAHEVNQPLAAIVANGSACVRWLDRERPALDEARAAVERIIRDASRAGEVIGETRALMKRAEGARSPLDLAEVIQSVLALVHAEVAKHRIAIRTAFAKDLPRVLGARVPLQQVVLNLVMNGIEAMAGTPEERRELSISAAREATAEGDRAVVTVRDTGRGLSDEARRRLFEAFYTTKPEGLGMGLSISRSIVHAHGGRLWLKESDGPGASLQFALPGLDAASA